MHLDLQGFQSALDVRDGCLVAFQGDERRVGVSHVSQDADDQPDDHQEAPFDPSCCVLVA